MHELFMVLFVIFATQAFKDAQSLKFEGKFYLYYGFYFSTGHCNMALPFYCV